MRPLGWSGSRLDADNPPQGVKIAHRNTALVHDIDPSLENPAACLAGMFERSAQWHDARRIERIRQWDRPVGDANDPLRDYAFLKATSVP